jgi:hypothetical protein
MTSVVSLKGSWQNNIKMDIIIGLKGLDWLHLTSDRDQWPSNLDKIMKVLNQ